MIAGLKIEPPLEEVIQAGVSHMGPGRVGSVHGQHDRGAFHGAVGGLAFADRLMGLRDSLRQIGRIGFSRPPGADGFDGGGGGCFPAPVAAQAVRHNQAQAVLPLPEKADGVFVFLPASRVGIKLLSESMAVSLPCLLS